ncbi:MAG: hypothetical protein HWN80_18075 [Candidatus Lokiarchaeota archaeon]|nr:hypothetical protein [Candidatus Lokiarchaeota archaeon]
MNRSEVPLLPDETILWEQSVEKNLLKRWPVYLIILIFADLLGLLFAVFIIMVGIWWISILLLFFIISTPWMFYKTNKLSNDRTREELKLSDVELMNYEFFDIFTNKRYIRRNYFLNFEQYVKMYLEAAYELVSDVYFLELKFVSKVLFKSRSCTIGLELEGFEDVQGIPVYINKKDISKFSALKESLITVLNLEYIDKGPHGIEIYRRKK